MSYLNNAGAASLLSEGELGLVTESNQRDWVNAISQNLGITQRYVAGPWNSTYKLGTWGVDSATRTAWAVLNYNGDFAVGLAAPVP